MCLPDIKFQQAENIISICVLLLKAHLFQSDDQLVDLNNIVIYPSSTMLFKVLYMTSGCS